MVHPSQSISSSPWSMRWHTLNDFPRHSQPPGSSGISTVCSRYTHPSHQSDDASMLSNMSLSAASIILLSPGTLSPGLRTIMSPGTNSVDSIIFKFPLFTAPKKFQLQYPIIPQKYFFNAILISSKLSLNHVEIRDLNFLNMIFRRFLAQIFCFFKVRKAKNMLGLFQKQSLDDC